MIFCSLFRPGLDSTPELTSTPKGQTLFNTLKTLLGLSPPAIITRFFLDTAFECSMFVSLPLPLLVPSKRVSFELLIDEISRWSSSRYTFKDSIDSEAKD